MTPQQVERWLSIQEAQVQVLERIAVSLERIAPTEQKAPNYVKPLSDFSRFNWASLQAIVVATDQHGATIVEWGGKQFLRRSPQNKFSEAIWFSRSTGDQDTEGKPIYERLVTFKQLSEVEPIPEKVSRVLAVNGRRL